MAKETNKWTFERWIAHVFDHPVRNPAWYFDSDAEVYSPGANPRQTVEYMRRLFESAVEYTRDYSDAQVNQGFNYLINPSASDHAFVLFDGRVPREIRTETFMAIYDVFEQVFAVRCSPHLSHNMFSKADTAAANPLNGVCYMWWDVFPLSGQSGNPEWEALCSPGLRIMARTLSLDSLACQESALHGLGHWHVAFPAEIESIIDRFLEAHPNVQPELRAYALQARRGHVL